MRFLLEDTSDLSIDAFHFLKEHPEFEQQIRDFETEFNISGSLSECPDLIDFLTENMIFSHSGSYEDSGYEVDYSDFDKPKLKDTKYSSDGDSNLYIETTVEAEANTTVYWGSHYSSSYYDPPEYEHEADLTIVGSAYLEVKIPKDVTNYDEYDFDGEDDIEYEVE